MQMKIRGGVKTITLDKSERKALVRASEVLDSLSIAEPAVKPVCGMVDLVIELIDDKGQFNADGQKLTWDSE